MTRNAARNPTPAGLRIRLVFDDGAMIGPGKADLLDLIRETGSIAEAGRRLGMSYKRAWMLVETLNATFATPLVESHRGGAGHGGATLTETGIAALALYRGLEAKATEAGSAEVAALKRLRADIAKGK
jgi:molybdate transport system regulatory protein